MKGLLRASSFLVGESYRFCIDRADKGAGEVTLTVKEIPAVRSFRQPAYIIIASLSGAEAKLWIEDVLWAEPV
ncbi:hypothetical protein D9M68_818130 [compost metagenome]